MSLKADLKKRIIEGMIQKARSGDEYVVLVLDHHTTRIVSSCARVYDIMESGVLVLENIQLKRERLDMGAIYFIEPSETSVKRLLEDFKDKDKPQYKEVHLYFTTQIPPEIMRDLSESNLVNRIKELKELNCDFIAFESRVFLLDRKLTVPSLYFPDYAGEVRRKELDQTARQIVSVCLTTNEYPYIRYTANNKICADLATKVEAGLNKLIAALPDWEIKTSDRSTLLIIDRSLDPIAPLMHEYTYQAMINDLLEVKGELVSIPARDGKDEKKSEDLVLGEDDHLWSEYRHQHIGEVMQAVVKKFGEFRGKNAMAGLKQEASMQDMIKAMKSMPEYNAMMRQYFKHMSIAEECMRHYDDEYLEFLSTLEQDMATNIDKDGKECKPKDIKNRVTTTCQSDKISVLNKLRIIMIYIISQGAVGSSRKDLWSAAGITFALEKAITNLKHLGIDIQRKPSATPRKDRQRESDQSRIGAHLMRFTPLLYDTVLGLVRDTLSRDTYPYLKDPPPKVDAALASKQARNADVSSSRRRGNWRTGADRAEKKEAKEQSKASGPRMMVYVLGGVTFSELRSIYEIGRETESSLLVGSSEALTPKDYIRSLGQFGPDDDLTKPGGTKKAGPAGAAAATPAPAGARGAARVVDNDDDDDDLDDD